MSAVPKHDVFQAIADPTRRHIMALLAESELSIRALTEHFPQSRTAIHKHLDILSDAGLVTCRKVGRETRYQLSPQPLTEVQAWVQFYERFWENKLNLLKHWVEHPPDDAQKRR